MIQELVLVLDGPNGFGLAFFLFGASVFWVPPVAPKWVPEQPLRQPVEAADEGLVCPEFGGLRVPKTGRNRPTKNGPNGPDDVSSWSVKPGVGPQMGPDWPSGGRQKQGRVHR